MEKLQKIKRKHLLQSYSSSDEPEFTKGKNKHHCCQPAPTRAPLPSDHYLDTRCPHTLVPEKRRKSKFRRSKRRERHRQLQAQHDESEARAEERSEFRRHVRKAQEITSKSEPGHAGTGYNAATLITQNRLTRGIYNQGKRSNKVVRDLSDASKSVQLKVKEGLKKIIGYKSPGKPVSITLSSHSALLGKTNLLTSSSHSASLGKTNLLTGSFSSPLNDNSANLQELLESTHLHITPPWSSNVVPDGVTALGRSSDPSSAFSAVSGVKELPESPLMEQLGAKVAGCLNLERYFADPDYLARVQNDLKKLIDMYSPQKRTPRMSSNSKSLSSARRKLEDAFTRNSPSDKDATPNFVQTQHHTPKRPTIYLPVLPSSNDCMPQMVHAEGSNNNSIGRSTQGADRQSSLKKFKESISSQAVWKHAPTRVHKVDATVQTTMKLLEESGQYVRSHRDPDQGELDHPAHGQYQIVERRGNSKPFPEINAWRRPASADAHIREWEKIGSHSVSGTLDACPSPWIKCCPMRKHWFPVVACRETLGTTPHAPGNLSQSQTDSNNLNIRGENIPSASGRRLDQRRICYDHAHKNQCLHPPTVNRKSLSFPFSDRAVGDRDRAESSNLHGKFHGHQVLTCSKKAIMERNEDFNSSIEEKEDSRQMANDDLSDDNMLDCLQLLKRSEEDMTRSTLCPKVHLQAGDSYMSNKADSRRLKISQEYESLKEGYPEETSQDNHQYQKENILRTLDSQLMDKAHVHSPEIRMQQPERHLGVAESMQNHSRREYAAKHPTAPHRQPLSLLTRNEPSPIQKRKKPFKWMTFADSSDTDDAMDTCWSPDLPLPPPPVLLLPDTPKMYPQKMF